MSERRPIQDVNIALGDDISKKLYEASKLTHANRPGLLEEFHESFSGARAISLSKLPDRDNLYVNLGFDGVGTKVEIAERIKDHSTVAHDLFAMVCDDAVVRGAEPVAIGSILDVNQLDDTPETHQAINELAYGYVEAARRAGVVVVNGEVAELGDRVGGHGPFNYNWGAAVMWIAHGERLLTGEQIKPGNTLVGFEEKGFRSNGITDVRKGMLERYGENWQEVVDRDLASVALGQLVRLPSTIYSKAVSAMTGGYDITREPQASITGVAHITGGGQPSKLRRMLEPSGYGAVINNPIEPPVAMTAMQEIRGFDDKKAYGKWHMGPGMVVATSTPEEVIQIAAEEGITAQAIGEVTEDSDLRILSRGNDAEWSRKKVLVYSPDEK